MADGRSGNIRDAKIRFTLVSTGRYSLDSRNVFNARNPKRLASLIDYRLEHPLQRAKLSQRYNSLARDLEIKHSIDAIEGLLLHTLTNYQKVIPSARILAS